MTPAIFLQIFPEFAKVDGVLISGKLALAAAEMGGPDFSIWGNFATPGGVPTQADMAHGNLAAHYLMTSPFGTSTLLVTPTKGGDGSTPYMQAFERIQLARCGGFVVAGSVV